MKDGWKINRTFPSGNGILAVSHLAALHFYFRRGSLNGGFAAAVSSEIDAAAVLKSTQHGVKVYLFTTVALLLPANRKSQIADFHHEFHVIYHGSSGEGSDCNKWIFIIHRNKQESRLHIHVTLKEKPIFFPYIPLTCVLEKFEILIIYFCWTIEKCRYAKKKHRYKLNRMVLSH